MAALVFDKYEVIRRLAVGGMGEIFLARQTGVGGFERLVILKSLLPDLAEDPDCVAEFLEEARIAATLNHPNIVAVYEVGLWEGNHLIAMEYVDGEDLAVLMRAATNSKRTIPLPATMRIIHDAAVALDFAHSARTTDGKPHHIVHRDVSPQNIMVRTDGVTKVLDFGIAKAATRVPRTAAGLVKGRVRYMAPEQLLQRHELDARTDQYSLGVVFWELCTMKRLHEGDVDRLADRNIVPPSVIAPEVPKEIDDLVMRMLERDRVNRFASCGEVANAIDRCMTSVLSVSNHQQLAKIVNQLVGSRIEERRRDLTPSKDGLLRAPHMLADVDAETKVIRQAEPSANVAGPRTKRTFLFSTIALLGAAIVLGVWTLRPPPGRDEAVIEASHIAQRGEYERARELIGTHLSVQPNDAEARMLAVLIEWWTSEVKKDTLKAALASRLSPAQRALVRAVELMTEGRRAEAVSFLSGENKKHPDQPEILYGLGEALWHDGNLDGGSTALRRCFEVDPSWLLALHHVVEYHLFRRQPEALAPIIERMRLEDETAADEVELRVLMNQRRYKEAIELGERAALRAPEDPKILATLADACALAGDFNRGEEAARAAFERWPIDDRGTGGLATWSEYLLYRGDAAEFARLLGEKRSHVYVLMQLLWRNESVPGFEPPSRSGANSLMIKKVLYMLNELQAGRKPGELENVDEPFSSYREAILASSRREHAAAVVAFERGLKMPASEDVNMLIWYLLAREYRALGDAELAAASCSEVLDPPIYEPYRAVLLPDCLLWIGESKLGGVTTFHRLVDAWKGEFLHPAVVSAKKRLNL